MAKKKHAVKRKPRGYTAVLSILIAIFLAIMIALPFVANYFDAVLRDFIGEAEAKSTTSSSASEDDEALDIPSTYNETDYDSYDTLVVKEREYLRKSAGEAVVLLKNDGVLPIATSSSAKAKVALFSQSSVDIVVGGSGSGESSSDVTLKEAFEADDFDVNGDLWDYYSNSGKSRGAGAAFSGSGGWYLNESSVSALQSGVDNFSSIQSGGTTAIFIMSRTGGEGADEPRYMGASASGSDSSKSYLEPDSTELEVISYLNNNFTDVVLVLNTNNMMETGWIDDYDHIKAVLWAPGAGDQTAYGIADVICGKVNPSGRLVDTMAYDDFSSPAMQNMGDFQYTNGGKDLKYYGVSYDEGIYVGYKYYETRYFDAVMGQGNATGSAGVYASSGNSWNYAEEVAYPFGYGLSYTTFGWSGFDVKENSDGTFDVSVTVKNTGDVAGKDVVQIYLNAPYTEYDKTNRVEKSAAELVGFAKTSEIEPGKSETVTVTVDKSEFATYDDVGEKTYIVETGDYCLTAAANVHDAVNNFLASEGKTVADGMTEGGDEAFVYTYRQSSLDNTTYSVSASGEKITNRFESAAAKDANTITTNCNYIDRSAYLSRQDWQGTWPEKHGTESTASSDFDEMNGHVFKEEISDALYSKLQESGTAAAANNPVDDGSITAEMAGEYEAEGELELIEYRGLAYADADWMPLISQMTTKEVGKIMNLSGYCTPEADSINKPKAVDKDGPAGLTNMVGSGDESIAFLTDVAVATTWNTDVSYYHGYFIAQDGLSFDTPVSGWYGPAMNIHRTPFAGRNFEYYSEDEFISGMMASSAVRGAADNGMYSFIKHFALNEQETHRADNGCATWCNEQAMREIYLRPFQMVAESGTVEIRYYAHDEDGSYVLNDEGEVEMTTARIPVMQAVMTSFNRIGATWAGGSYQLLTEILRDEWGFDGFVLTDYSQGATGYMHTTQMLRAGGDAELSQFGSNYSIKTDAETYYTKQAMSHILFTVVNSNAMNGYVKGTINSARPFAYYILVEIAFEIVFAVCIIVMAVCMSNRWKRYHRYLERKAARQAQREQQAEQAQAANRGNYGNYRGGGYAGYNGYGNYGGYGNNSGNYNNKNNSKK